MTLQEQVYPVFIIPRNYKVPNRQHFNIFPDNFDSAVHTCAKLIEIQKNYLQKIHGLHELGSRMECKDTLHGSGLGPHWVLGPNYSKFGPMGPKNFAQKFLYTK